MVQGAQRRHFVGPLVAGGRVEIGEAVEGVVGCDVVVGLVEVVDGVDLEEGRAGDYWWPIRYVQTSEGGMVRWSSLS